MSEMPEHRVHNGAKLLRDNDTRISPGQYGVQGFPTIKFMYHDGGKIKSVDYKGSRTAKEIIEFGMDKAKALAFKRIGEKVPKASGGGGGSGGGGSKSGSGSGTARAGGSGAYALL
jgi:hypothetical protein